MLQRQKLENNSISPTPTIPENAPTVSFDTRLGKKYSSIDFDYEAFKAEADRVGLPDDAAHDLHIHFTPPTWKAIKGMYFPKTHENEHEQSDPTAISEGQPDPNIKVVLDKNIDATLAHELKHAADDAEGLLKYDYRYHVGRVGILASRVSGPATVLNGVSLVNSLNGNPYPAVQAVGLALTGASILAGGAVAYGYMGHPSERRARAASKGANPVIKFSKHQKK